MNLYAVETYEVHFTTIDDPAIINLLRSTSQLIALENNPPSTAAALRKRAEADIPRFAKILQTLAYYDAQIDLRIQIDMTPAQVIFDVNPGDLFVFSDFEVTTIDDDSSAICQCISLDELEIEMGMPAYPKNILHAEELLLLEIATYGYPLAKIKERKVIADVANKSISVTLVIDTGPQARFGPTTISGAKKVCDSFFQKKIAWGNGEIFNPCKIEETLQALEASSLFSTINITFAETVEEDNLLPMSIDVMEAKHRSTGFGIGYSTMRSFGVVGEYDNFNERHLGERFALRGAIWHNLFDGTYLYLVPDWHRRRQDLVWLMQAHHEITDGYTESFLSPSVSVERQVSYKLRTSAGFMFKHLKITDSDNNGLFNLFKIPLSLRWTDVDDPLDPSYGYTVTLKTVPTLEIFNDPFSYAINTVNFSSYLPLDYDGDLVLATRATLGSIFGSSRRTIPPSELFYAGSEETIRGYRYLTVSPLNRKHEPTGGRSMMIFNVELRRSISENWGIVLFYDIGNVYKGTLPNWNEHRLQSTGLGLRYDTPAGPLRLDIALPLNKRKHVDHNFEVYFSLGQTF